MTDVEYIVSGLDSSAVEESRRRYGTNLLTPPPKKSLWRKFLGEFSDPLIIILIVAGILSVGISFYEYYGLGHGAEVFFEPVGIFVAIFLATGLAFWFEQKAEREFSILNQVCDDQPVTVIRNGSPTSVGRRDIVVGDVVLLDTGAEIPADGRLVRAVTLSVDESSLTGEPVCSKTADKTQADPEATYASDRVLRGTKVMEGHGVMIVEAVGDATENGRVFKASSIDDTVRTPLDEQLSRLGRFVTMASYTVAALIVVGRIVMYFLSVDFNWIGFITYFLQTCMIAVTLVVVAVPEGLPMAVTLSLAYSMRRMLQTNNLVRRLHACETMGATTVICTDKTGTLTCNQMRVAGIELYGDHGQEVISEAVAVNSTASLDLNGDRPIVLGSPTEGALLLWLHDRGVDYECLRQNTQTLAEIPFSTERKYMATEVISGGRRRLYVKGAPEIVLEMCRSVSDSARDEIGVLLLGYQRKAMRTLGFAWTELCDGQEGIADGRIVAPLEFIGIAAISDPVRDDVPQAVDTVRAAGIKVKIVTGDTPATAMEIGRQIGLWDDDVDPETGIITGDVFAALSDEQLDSMVDTLRIIARARPLDKKRLVEALQRKGEVVAVTGDGTNDAPALKTAHVGLSMGDGTAVAKEASDITIIDNSFSSIGRAVMWGRSLYRNIQRFILFQLTVNVAACLIVLAGAFMGMQSPLTVTQMLWVNLIMDTFAAMALASLPPSQTVMMSCPRRREDFIIDSRMWRFVILTGGVFFLILLALLWYLENVSLISLTQVCAGPYKDTVGLSPYELSVFFTFFVFLQFWNMFNARAYATGQSAFRLRGCRGFCLIAVMIFFGQIVIVELGGAFFGVVPLSLTDWLIIILSTSSVVVVGEMARAFRRIRVSDSGKRKIA